MNGLVNVFIVFAGGGLGSVLRYTLGIFVVQKLQLSAPWATFSVNFIGSLVLGLLMAYFYKSNITLDRPLVLFLALGVCGGFTTFSTFSIENLMLFKEENWVMLFLYPTSSIVFGFFAAYVGYQLLLK